MLLVNPASALAHPAPCRSPASRPILAWSFSTSCSLTALPPILGPSEALLPVLDLVGMNIKLLPPSFDDSATFALNADE